MATQGAHRSGDSRPDRFLSEKASSLGVNGGGSGSVCMLPNVVGKTLYFTYHLQAIRMPCTGTGFSLLHAYVYQSGRLPSTKKGKTFPFLTANLHTEGVP